MPRIDVKQVPVREGSSYPAPYDREVRARQKQRLGDAGGLSDFGVNLTRLPPGTWSSHRHWHSAEDEFVHVLSGELVLVTDAGEEILRAGDCAAFPKNSGDGHHLINRGAQTATYLEIGTRTMGDICSYPDIDMHLDKSAGKGFTRKDGSDFSR
ncbi:MAG TPA: cupin domain-containing protein [Rhizomicrobium sp.]|nr:cupin domain-containing protein [Rhizomicrobium sp.]